jgi:hypothetical protein
MKTAMLSPRKKIATQNDAQQTVELIDTELDMVAGGINPGFGVGTAFTSGVEGALNVAHVLIATENAPNQAPPSANNGSLIGSGSITAGAGNPSNFVGR